MSNPKQNATERSVGSRSHGQTRIRARDEGDEEKQQQPAQSSAHVSPAMRVYRHALESVFAMLELTDLSRVLAVSRSWSAAVRSMAPINASILRFSLRLIRGQPAFSPLPSVAALARSPLLRHLAGIQIGGGRAGGPPLTNEALGLLAQHAPNLTSLHCLLELTSNKPLILPAKLSSLDLQLYGAPTDSAVNGVLTTVATLPLLARLCFNVAYGSSDDMRILASCRSLTDLALKPGYFPFKLSHTQLNPIRSSLGHLQRINIGSMETNMRARLLQPPVTAQWQDIGTVDAGPLTGDLLLRLQTLTKLDLCYMQRTAHVDFLPQLALLATINLDCDSNVGWLIPADARLASLQLCTSISELSLRCGFKSAHWSALFARLTLKKLTINGGDLETLGCFAAGPITQSLDELGEYDVALPQSELDHLLALSRLRTLHLAYAFSRRLNDAAIDSLSPPTAYFPLLTKFSSWWRSPHDDFEDEGVERRGPSYEWMQARLTM